MNRTTDEGFKKWLATAALAGAMAGAPAQPANVAPADTTTTAVVQASRSIRGNYAPEFIAYIKRVENAGKDGWDGKVWMPHGSPEGGTATLAYGHKLTPREVRTGVLENGVPWKSGITDEQANDLLIYDLNEEWDDAAQYIAAKHNANMRELSPARQEMLVDMSFNPGITIFPKFTKAVVQGNWDPADKNSAVNQYKRMLNGKELGRNKHFYRRYFASGVLDGDTADHSGGLN